MAPPRRVRDEALTLRRTGLPDIELFRQRESIYLHEYPTQNRFQVAANASAIAFTTPEKNHLTIVRRDGTIATFDGIHHHQFRISPDGQMLAAARYDAGTYGMSRIDLHTMQQAARAQFQNVIWAEYCAEGLLVLGYKYVPGNVESSITLWPSKEEPRTIAQVDAKVTRFACAKGGKNIAYFVRDQIWSVAEPGAQAIRIAELGHDIINAEMSPDGRSLIVLTAQDACLFEDGKFVSFLGIPAAHTVWFSGDGKQFVVANAHRAHWQRGEKTATLTGDLKSPIRTARFAPMSPWIMVARGADAVRWNPEQDEAEVIASADAGQEMLGVDVFGGGVVIWTGTTWQMEDRHRSRG
jgi:dipeptidyl aminopeptidase/acylaminoacyl peptidase